jgi:ribosome biogenesis protein Nip4
MPTKRPINERLAELITDMVGSMWCAYVFAGLAFVSLPQALEGGRMAFVAWLSQTFLQLVLLSVIMVGQDVSTRKAERRSEKTYKDAEEILKILRQNHAMITDSIKGDNRIKHPSEKNPHDPLDGPETTPHPW